MADVRCAHGDPTCPCNDGLVCNYEDFYITGRFTPSPGRLSKRSTCPNPACGACGREAVAS